MNELNRVFMIVSFHAISKDFWDFSLELDRPTDRWSTDPSIDRPTNRPIEHLIQVLWRTFKRNGKQEQGESKKKRATRGSRAREQQRPTWWWQKEVKQGKNTYFSWTERGWIRGSTSSLWEPRRSGTSYQKKWKKQTSMNWFKKCYSMMGAMQWRPRLEDRFKVSLFYLYHKII